MSGLTSGRELPPRREQSPREDLPRPTASPAIARRPLPEARLLTQPAVRPGRPDARPMRVAYGAGAVAAVSVMAVGLVQPDWSGISSASPRQETAVAVAPEVTAHPTKRRTARPPLEPSSDAKRKRVRHVTRYIYLRPGETAPPGATVITRPGRDKTGAKRPPRVDPTSPPRRPRGGNNAGKGSNNGPVATKAPRATPRPTPKATARPTPKPTIKTRQSGR